MLLFIKDAIIHANILNLLGLAEVEGDQYVVSEYCAKGEKHSRTYSHE